jgi:hypothetical protein
VLTAEYLGRANPAPVSWSPGSGWRFLAIVEFPHRTAVDRSQVRGAQPKSCQEGDYVRGAQKVSPRPRSHASGHSPRAIADAGASPSIIAPFGNVFNAGMTPAALIGQATA